MNVINEQIKFLYKQNKLPSSEQLQTFLQKSPCENKFFALVNLIIESNINWSFYKTKKYFSQILDLMPIKYNFIEKSWLLFYLVLISRKDGLDHEASIIYNEYKALPKLNNNSIFLSYIKLQVQLCIATINLILNVPRKELEQNLKEIESYSDDVRNYINII